ncbi:hypothetical protein BHE74_00005241 [Ensete ventricosum]|nr:hypothetical protein BHE74_00005241 [Ensete ventricosum]
MSWMACRAYPPPATKQTHFNDRDGAQLSRNAHVALGGTSDPEVLDVPWRHNEPHVTTRASEMPLLVRERDKGRGRWRRPNRKTQSGEHKRVAAPIRPSPSRRALLVRFVLGFHSKKIKIIILQLAMSTVSSASLRNGSSVNNSFRSESFSEEKDMGLVQEAGCLSIIVLGASGDLAKKKTFPALFHIFQQVRGAYLFRHTLIDILNMSVAHMTVRKLVLRFANRFFMPLWNRDNIDNIQVIFPPTGAVVQEIIAITMNLQIVFREDFGTEGRGGYFDEYGYVYFMHFENWKKHTFQTKDQIFFLALGSNHSRYHSKSFAAGNGKQSIYVLLQVLCLVAMEKPVSLKPEHIRDEKVKVRTHVVWTKFNCVFICLPYLRHGCKKQGRNEFVIRLQPSEAMYMKLTVSSLSLSGVKKPGLQMSTIQSELDLSYGLRYQDVKIPEAYERLILDTYVAWEIFTPLLHSIDDGQLKPISYEPGSRGPAEADELLAKAGYVQTHGYIWIPPTLA